MNQKEEIFKKMCELLKPLYPRMLDYHTNDLKKVIDHFERLGKRKENYDLLGICGFLEEERMSALSNIRTQIENELIKSDVLKKHPNMHLYENKPKNDHEKGVYQAIGFIRFIIDCAYDD